MAQFMHHVLFWVRTLAAFWLNVFLLFRYWAQLHPLASTCGFIGCSLNTAAYITLLAVGVGVLAGIIDLILRRPKDLTEIILSVFYALFVFVASAGLNFAAEKTPQVRVWLEGLVAIQ